MKKFQVTLSGPNAEKIGPRIAIALQAMNLACTYGAVIQPNGCYRLPSGFEATPVEFMAMAGAVNQLNSDRFVDSYSHREAGRRLWSGDSELFEGTIQRLRQFDAEHLPVAKR